MVAGAGSWRRLRGAAVLVVRRSFAPYFAIAASALLFGPSPAMPQDHSPSLPSYNVPRYIRLHPDDNVAVVSTDFGLPAGTVFPFNVNFCSPRLVSATYRLPLESVSI